MLNHVHIYRCYHILYYFYFVYVPNFLDQFDWCSFHSIFKYLHLIDHCRPSRRRRRLFGWRTEKTCKVSCVMFHNISWGWCMKCAQLHFRQGIENWRSYSFPLFSGMWVGSNGTFRNASPASDDWKIFPSALRWFESLGIFRIPGGETMFINF